MYKKFVRKFEEGSPQEWIDMLKDLDEIWTQNSMTGDTDRSPTVRALVRGESTVQFETALKDYRVTAEGETVPISTEHVQESLKAVTETVFPHRALETQRLWMNRKMFKPVELTTRQMAASINCLNDAPGSVTDVAIKFDLLQKQAINEVYNQTCFVPICFNK
jgi:hypothetical protein